MGELTVYDDIVDLRGDQKHKNLEKAYGPDAVITMKGGHRWYVRRCPLCQCIKSFDPSVPNNTLFGCDGECPCHDA